MNLATIALLAQLARPCSDLSAGNPPLYHADGGVMHCFDWNQATCSYVERPCQAGELSLLCLYLPATCRYLAPKPGRPARPSGPRVLTVRAERP